MINKLRQSGQVVRKTIFWIHLVAGIISGLVIGVMSFTGVALAFEKEIVNWVDRAGARVTPPTESPRRLELDELVRRAETTRPGDRISNLTLHSDPAAALTASLGAAPVYINPYTGMVTPQGAERTRVLMRTLTSWHRYLALGGEQRALGKAITGAGNAAFLVLAVTGLYIWMPRTWSWRLLRPVLWFRSARGKARDWNWHNVIGLWSAPVLIVLTATALPISYTGVSRFINELGATAEGNPTTSQAAPFPSPALTSESENRSLEELLSVAQASHPDWSQISVRLNESGRGGPGGRGRGGPPPGRGRGDEPAAGGIPRGGTFGERPGSPPGSIETNATLSISIREANSWPRTASTNLSLDRTTGEVLSREGYADLSTGRQIRSWTRFLHTGEALGNLGQLVAGLACLGGCVLVYTGFALSWRRFLARRPRG